MVILIVETAVKFDTPLELNLGGFNYNNIIAAKNGGYPYPCKEFFKIVAEYNAKVVIGVDAHIPQDFIKNRYDIVMEYVKELNDYMGNQMILFAQDLGNVIYTQGAKEQLDT